MKNKRKKVNSWINIMGSFFFLLNFMCVNVESKTYDTVQWRYDNTVTAKRSVQWCGGKKLRNGCKVLPSPFCMKQYNGNKYTELDIIIPRQKYKKIQLKNPIDIIKYQQKFKNIQKKAEKGKKQDKQEINNKRPKSNYITLLVNGLNKGSISFFFSFGKRPNSKYLRVLGHKVCHNYSALQCKSSYR